MPYQHFTQQIRQWNTGIVLTGAPSEATDYSQARCGHSACVLLLFQIGFIHHLTECVQGVITQKYFILQTPHMSSRLKLSISLQQTFLYCNWWYHYVPQHAIGLSHIQILNGVIQGLSKGAKDWTCVFTDRPVLSRGRHGVHRLWFLWSCRSCCCCYLSSNCGLPLNALWTRPYHAHVYLLEAFLSQRAWVFTYAFRVGNGVGRWRSRLCRCVLNR